MSTERVVWPPTVHTRVHGTVLLEHTNSAAEKAPSLGISDVNFGKQPAWRRGEIPEKA